MFRHILVPTDGSSLSQEAVGRAADLARETGARITLLHVRPQDPAVYLGVGAIGSPHLGQELQARLDQAARDSLATAQVRVQAAGVSCEPVLLQGQRPWEGIIQAAQERGCDLILMASHGRRGVDALLLGSETQKVLTHSRIPVLVYR